MGEDRFALSLQVFSKAVEALDRALAQPEDEYIRDSLIKRFDLAFESGRKCLRQWLIAQQEVAAHDTKKAVMEAAHRTGLLRDVELWNEIVRWRNDSSHEYDEARALALAAFVRERAAAAFRQLAATLSSRA